MKRLLLILGLVGVLTGCSQSSGPKFEEAYHTSVQSSSTRTWTPCKRWKTVEYVEISVDGWPRAEAERYQIENGCIYYGDDLKDAVCGSYEFSIRTRNVECLEYGDPVTIPSK